MKRAVCALTVLATLGCGGGAEGVTAPAHDLTYELIRDPSSDLHYSPRGDTLYVTVVLGYAIPLSSGFGIVAVENALLTTPDTLVVRSSLRTGAHGRAEIVWRRPQPEHCDGEMPSCPVPTLTLSYDNPRAVAPVSLSIPDSSAVAH